MKLEDSGNNNNINSELNEKSNNYDQFPIKDKKSQIILDKDIRNFSLPMGMMTLTEAGEKRKNNYIEKFTLMKKELTESPQSHSLYLRFALFKSFICMSLLNKSFSI